LEKEFSTIIVQKGNGPKVNLVGEHKFPLVLFHLTYPKAHASVVIQFIAMNSSNPVTYSRGDITVAKQSLGFTRKVGSTLANQALSYS
jgi:hypothetical protein